MNAGSGLALLETEAPGTKAESGPLTTRQGVKAMVRTWQGAMAQLRAAFDGVGQVEAAFKDVFPGGDFDVFRHIGDGRSYTRDHNEAFAKCQKAFRLEGWSQIVKELKIRDIMSLAERKELDARLQGEGGVPLGDITEESVTVFMGYYLGQIDEMLKATVLEVFEILRPRNSKLKTNSEFEIGNRVILHGYLDRMFLPSCYVASGWNYRDNLDAIHRVFAMLEGKSTTTAPHIAGMIDRTLPGEETETEYMTFVGRKNLNLQVTFKRPDLVKRLNEIAGGNRLKGEKATGGPRYAMEMESPNQPEDNGKFWTPEDIAKEMVSWALDGTQCEYTMRVLEPSVGAGALAKELVSQWKALMTPKLNYLIVDTVDNCYEHEFRDWSSEVSAEVPEIVVTAHKCDFMRSTLEEGIYDIVLMNPPFHGQADALHVAKAIQMLKPGGKLAAIVSSGTQEGRGKHRAMLAASLKHLCSYVEWRGIMPGAFKESGTMVGAEMLLVVK